MASSETRTDARIAVLVDCDNTSPEILEYSLRVVAQFGRVVLRRGYGNQHALASRWQETLVRLAFTPCLQYQYAAGKNTADIALALDALEAMFDDRADTFCLITSDSDFSYLCRKLRERGATVHIVGEPKTPVALRNASDQFFEWQKSPALAADSPAPEKPLPRAALPRNEPSRADVATSPHKLSPPFVVDAVSMLAADTPEGKITVSALGSYLKRTDPAFSPQTYGHSGLLDMIRTYDGLQPQQEPGGHWSVRLAPTEPDSADEN